MAWLTVFCGAGVEDGVRGWQGQISLSQLPPAAGANPGPVRGAQVAA